MQNFKEIPNQYQQNNHHILEEYKKIDFHYENYDQPLDSGQTEPVPNKNEPI
jgi:hypothetical protein